MKNSACCVLAVFSTMWTAAFAAAPTGLQAIKEANRYVTDEVKDKIVQMHSEKSTNMVTPEAWCIVYYNSAARRKTTEVKLATGKDPVITHPFRLFKPADAQAILDPAKLKVDSDSALWIAKKDGLLDKIKLTDSKLVLERWEEAPVWKVRFWAEKAGKPGQTTDIGQIFVNAEDGKIVNRDLHLDRID
jgi:hypothetical protein